MELTYTKYGDYYLPDLVLPQTPEYHIGKYGRLRKRYLREHRPILYTNMVQDGSLWPHLDEIDKACNERMENLVAAMARAEGVTESLKASDQMEWVGRMNNIRNRAEEIVLCELIYNN